MAETPRMIAIIKPIAAPNDAALFPLVTVFSLARSIASVAQSKNIG
jgi:hypothetical protein